MNQYIKHPVIGQMIIDFVEDLKPVGELIRHHHEHFNGSGFPDKLKKEKIPIGSRIIAIVDRFERLAEGFSVRDSLKKISFEVSQEFDPLLYNVLEITAYELEDSLFSPDDIIEAELSIQNISPGLLLSRDVMGNSGLVLLKKDSVLTAKNIEQLAKAFHMDQVQHSIFVYKKRK